MIQALLHPGCFVSAKQNWLVLSTSLLEKAKNVSILSDESGIMYAVDGNYDPTENMEFEDESLLDDIDFGW